MAGEAHGRKFKGEDKLGHKFNSNKKPLKHVLYAEQCT